MAKVEWICIVPNCKSNSRVPGHFFPKNVTLSYKWKEAINNNIPSRAKKYFFNVFKNIFRNKKRMLKKR